MAEGSARKEMDTKDGYYFKANGRNHGPLSSEKFEWYCCSSPDEHFMAMRSPEWTVRFKDFV